MREKHEKMKWIIFGVLQMLILIGVYVDVALSLKLSAKMDALVSLKNRRSLPCESIPIRFVLDDSVCADKLLLAMNVTNVRVLAKGSRLPRVERDRTVGPLGVPNGNRTQPRSTQASTKIP